MTITITDGIANAIVVVIVGRRRRHHHPQQPQQQRRQRQQLQTSGNLNVCPHLQISLCYGP